MRKEINKDMGLISENGVLVDGDILLKCAHEHLSGSYLILRILIAFTATFSVAAMSNSFVGEPERTSVLFFFSLIATMTFGMFASKYGIVKFCAAATAIIYAGSLILKRKAIKNGFIIAVYDYLKLSGIASGSWSTAGLGFDKYDPTFYFYFFAALILVVSFGCVFGCIYRIDFPVLFIFTFPLFEIGMYQGMEAPTFSVLGLVVSWVTILAMHIINHTTNKAGRKNTFAVHERSKTFFFTSQAAKSQFYTVYIAFVSIITAAVFLGVVLFSGLTGFVRPESFTQKRLNLHHAMTSFDLNNVDEFFSDLSGGSNLYGVNTVGGTNGGVLGTSNGISFNGVTALKVTSSKFNYPMYIRGYMGGQYENNCWNPLENDKEIEEITEQFAEIGCFAQDYDYIYVDSSRYYTGSQLDIMDITVKGACPKFIYAPYAAIYSGSPDLSKLGEKLKPHQDDYVRVSKSETSYSVVYWNFGNSSWSGRVRDLRSTEADYTSKTRKVMNAYYDYVCDNYLYSVKLDSLDKVYDEIVETYLDGDPYGSSYYDIVSAIADYFDSNYTYDLNPGATPKDRDFIDYFLTEQKKGYCSYFATVGTQLMRKFGYPARYTEGYMVLPSQQGEPMSDGRYEVNVPDKCAHAWTEVFIEGAGWVPAEFTPGYNNDNPNLSDKEKNIEKTVTTTTTTTAADESSKKENTGSSSSKSENSKAPSNSSKSAVSSSDTDSSSSRAAGIGVVGSSSEGGGAGGTVSPMVKTLIITLITVALGAAAVIVNRRHKLKVMEDRCTQKDLNKRAAEIYKYTLRYLSLLDIEVNRNITDLQQCDELLEKCHSKMITEIDDKLVDLALITVKAMMSSSGITEEEAEKAAAIMEHISQQVVGSSLNQLKMVSAKYLYCLY